MENKFNLIHARKGNATADYVIGLMVAVILIVALAPTIFSFAADFANTTKNPNVPTWLPTVFTAVISVALLIGVLVAVGLYQRKK